MHILRKPSYLLLLLVGACATDATTSSNEPTGLRDEGSAFHQDAPDPDEPVARAAGVPMQDDVRQEIERARQKRQVMAQSFIEQADDAFSRGDYERAYALYADAFQLDADSREARDGLRRTEAAMGGRGFDVESAEDLMGQQAIRWARERMRVEGLVADGDRHMQSGDFDSAIRQYESAHLALRYSPNLASGALTADVVSAKLDSARQAQSDSVAAARAAEQAAASADAAAIEEARAQYFDNRIQALFSEANSQFSRGFYDKATGTLDRLLELDPRNESALELREVANDAWHAQRQRQTASSYREEWRNTFLELRTIAVPPKASIEHDVDYWRNTVLARKPLDEIAEEAEVDLTKVAIERVLEETRFEPRFDNPIEEIAQNLTAYTRVNYVVSRAIREDLDEDTKTIRFSQNRPMSVAKLHRIIEDLSNGEIRFVIRNGVVNVVSPTEATGGQVLRYYEVRDIVRKVQDFVATEINLSPSGGIDQVEEELPEKEATILTEDELLEAIQENIASDTWGEDDGGTVSIENGTLIVYHTPEVQKQVQGLLGDLRKATNIMVEIKVRFLKVEDSFLQDIGVDFRGLGDDATAGEPGKGQSFVFDDFGSDPGSPASPGTIGTGNDSGLYFREADDNLNLLGRTENLYDVGLGDENVLVGSGGLSLQWTYLDDSEVEMILRMVEKSKRSEIVTEPKLMVYNTSRANLTVANQISYVGDFDVQIAQAAAIADPIVRVAQDGVYLDVRPTVSADRRFISIDVRPTVATLRRPIPTFQTSLGTGSPVTLQLPELEIQKVRTPVMIPDGGTLLLGGMKIVDQQNLESGVPFLNRVPILSFFFSRKGEFKSYRKLIILLTARIIIPNEFEPSPLPGGR